MNQFAEGTLKDVNLSTKGVAIVLVNNNFDTSFAIMLESAQK